MPCTADFPHDTEVCYATTQVSDQVKECTRNYRVALGKDRINKLFNVWFIDTRVSYDKKLLVLAYKDFAILEFQTDNRSTLHRLI